jgi:hypothetical protein
MYNSFWNISKLSECGTSRLWQTYLHVDQLDRGVVNYIALSPCNCKRVKINQFLWFLLQETAFDFFRQMIFGPTLIFDSRQRQLMFSTSINYSFQFIGNLKLVVDIAARPSSFLGFHEMKSTMCIMSSILLICDATIAYSGTNPCIVSLADGRERRHLWQNAI